MATLTPKTEAEMGWLESNLVLLAGAVRGIGADIASVTGVAGQ